MINKDSFNSEPDEASIEFQKEIDLIKSKCQIEGLESHFIILSGTDQKTGIYIKALRLVKELPSDIQDEIKNAFIKHYPDGAIFNS